MGRIITGTVANVVVWIAIVTLLNLALRTGWPAYAGVEKAMAFTLPMLVARLAMSAVSSLVGGAVGAILNPTMRAPLIGGVVLFAIFVPVHYGLWERFPVWYHITFLASLPLLGWLGGRLLQETDRTALGESR